MPLGPRNMATRTGDVTPTIVPYPISLGIVVGAIARRIRIVCVEMLRFLGLVPESRTVALVAGDPRAVALSPTPSRSVRLTSDARRAEVPPEETC